MIAVTGANGLLGSFIIRKLVELREPFVALKRENSDISLLQDIAHAITWRNADVTDEVSLLEALEDVTHVIHAAAVVSFNPRKANMLMDINMLGTRHVVNACLVKSVKRLVHISSVAALGRQKEQRTIDEKNKWVANSVNSQYAESKYFAELEVFRGQEEGLSTVIINPSIILAPANWNNSSAKLFKYVWDEKPFYTDGYMNYVDVRDVADIACRMLHQPVEGERFIANAGNISFKNFFTDLAQQFQKKAPGIKLNSSTLKIIARLENIRTWFTRSEPLITRETARIAGTEFLYDNQKIKKLLSFEFQPIDRSIDWCCQYYREKMSVKK
ncbi:MAG TPA: NAD-dependent epimerase/dehydratase family protein [Ohtaekwangia sp.]|uniref:NAD-dependent epimerase/dehydratase family protein n=1 Tax=Ohtaekwangia sp. TaxID=2066019 RepID=UPI002F951C9B